MTPTTTETQTVAHSRRLPKWMATVGAPVAGVVVGLGIGALLILIAGANPFAAYAVMFHGAFGGPRQIEETLLKTAPLLLMGLGLTAAFRARVWNIGGEGQYYIGALIGGAIALTFPTWPRPLLIAAMLIGGVVGGMLWATIAGLLKVRRGMSEIISTLMLNYIAILLRAVYGARAAAGAKRLPAPKARSLSLPRACPSSSTVGCISVCFYRFSLCRLSMRYCG